MVVDDMEDVEAIDAQVFFQGFRVSAGFPLLLVAVPLLFVLPTFLLVRLTAGRSKRSKAVWVLQTLRVSSHEEM